MHYEALPHPALALSRVMLRFTEEFAVKITGNESRGEGFTGHLSFDFLVDEQVTEQGVESVLRAIECNPRAHTAVAMFRGKERELVKAYLSALDGDDADGRLTNGTNGHVGIEELQTQQQQQRQPQTDALDSNSPAVDIVFPQPSVRHIYWIGHDLITLLLLPLLHLFGLAQPMISLPSYLYNCYVFLDHMLFWQDGTYEVWDPLPAWWLYHVYWPGMFVGSLLMGKRWSRINVGTGKMFGC